MNARTGYLNSDFEVDDAIQTLTTDSAKTEQSTPRGTLLVDFLAYNRLSILNGNTLGDILWELLTSINYNAASVVD